MTIPIPVVLTKLWKPKRSPIKGLDKEQRIVREKVCLFFLTIVVNKTIFPLQKFFTDPPPPPSPAHKVMDAVGNAGLFKRDNMQSISIHTHL
jgi:hypothetical protein